MYNFKRSRFRDELHYLLVKLKIFLIIEGKGRILVRAKGKKNGDIE